jgi:hypothetical protein
MCQFSSIKAISVAIIKQEGEFVISKNNICKYSLKLILYLQSDVVLQHEIHQLQEYDLVVDTAKLSWTTL